MRGFAKRSAWGLVAIAAGLTLAGEGMAQTRDTIRSVYKIGVTDSDGVPVVGSAVLVAPGKLVTSCHTTRGAGRIQVLHPQGELLARAGKADERRDLCVLNVPELRGPIPQRVPSSNLAIGEAVTAVGFGTGFRLSVQSGEITALFAFDNSQVVRTSAAFPRGASGGGLFDQEGRLVGILTFKGSGDEALNYAVPVEWIDSLLADDVQGLHDRLPLAFWEDDALDQPMFLRASSLLREARWKELETLASDWVLLESENSEAWFALGRAKFALNLNRDAAIALRTAVSLNGRNVRGWYWLARAYHDIDFAAGFLTAHSALNELDAALAADMEANLRRTASNGSSAR